MLDYFFNFEILINFYLVFFGFKVIVVIVIWIVGGMFINIFFKIVCCVLIVCQFEIMFINYVSLVMYVILCILLVMGILEVCGILIIFFVVMIGVVGVVLGVVWLGLLFNFVVGIFLVVLCLFKVGDYIIVVGQIGMVFDIGLVIIIIIIDNNLCVIIGNNKLFLENIINYNVNVICCIDLCCQIVYGVDLQEVINKFFECIKVIFNVLQMLVLGIVIQEFNVIGILIVLCVYVFMFNFGQVYNDVQNVIVEVCLKEGWLVLVIYQVVVLLVQLL